MASPALFAARLILGSIFLISGIIMLVSANSVADEIMDYQLLSARSARLVAPFLPIFELLLAILLLAAIELMIAASAAFLLLITFTAAIAINLGRGRRFNCHCFGSSNAIIGPAVILRNGFLSSSPFS